MYNYIFIFVTNIKYEDSPWFHFNGVSIQASHLKG